MKPPLRLRGITWDHTRGLLPLQATAQRFHERHPGVEISWEKRSLQAFADQPLQQLAKEFDLLVIDHPFVGYAAAHGTLCALDELLPEGYLADQAAQSVGASHRSYCWEGRCWALAIDAATPVSIARSDLLAASGRQRPVTWEDVLALADGGRVAVAGKAVDSLMNFWMLCVALGEEPCSRPAQVVSRDVGAQALHLLRGLLSRCRPECRDWNPIQVCEAMSSGDDFLYCPFAYGYSNYARAGYGRARLDFGGLVTLHGRRLRSTLGGTGLAISAGCAQAELAAEYAAYVASPACQRTIYTFAGGQPGHRAAWLDEDANLHTHGYFRATLSTLDQAWLRPRYAGYLGLQERGAEVVHRWLVRGGDVEPALAELDRLYRESRNGEIVL